MRVVCCALLPFYFVASSEIHSFWVLEELRISIWPSPFSGNRLISVSSTTNATSFETASPRERTVWGEKNRLLQEHFYKHRILHGEINPLMTKFCLRIILLSNDLTWQKKKKNAREKKVLVVPFHPALIRFRTFIAWWERCSRSNWERWKQIYVLQYTTLLPYLCTVFVSILSIWS